MRTMDCKHSYFFTDGYFRCAKCGYERPGKDYKKNNTKFNLGSAIIIISAIVGLLFVNGIIEFNPENLDKSLQNSPQIIQNAERSNQDLAVETSTPIQETSNNKLETAQNKVSEIKTPLISIENKIRTKELIQHALDKINEDREKNNLKPVVLSSNSAAQSHANDVFSQKIISHWMSNGEKPYMTYTNFGGAGSVSQNVAISYCSGFGCSMDPIKEIERAEYSMMHDDASSDWGHRDNILQPYHTHVSIGISYDDNFFVLVQNFEDNYLMSENPISVTENHVYINSNLKSGNPQNIGIFYDPLPTPQLYLQHRNDGHYELGDYVAVVVPPAPLNSYYEQPSKHLLIEAENWTADDNFILIDFDISSILVKPGVYTIGIWIDEGGKDFLVTNYAIFYN